MSKPPTLGLAASLSGCGVDNVIVEMDAAKAPIMDGSAKAFVERGSPRDVTTAHPCLTRAVIRPVVRPVYNITDDYGRHQILKNGRGIRS